MMTLRVGAALALAPVAMSSVACGKVEDKPDERSTVVELAAKPNRDLDLLFVVDDSPSMLDKQINLTTNFPGFLDRLQGVPGGLPNLHVGVVSTDMGTKASGSPTPGPSIGQIGQGGCAATGKGGALQTGTAMITDKYLRDEAAADGTRSRNYTGTLADAFSAMARLGAGGCGFEQPLAAMRAALDGNPANVGFLRPEAVLGVVFLSDEDDCSAKSTQIFGPETAELGPLQSFRCTRFGVTCADGGATSDAMNQVGPKGGCVSNASSTLVDDIAPYSDFLRGLKSDPQRLAVTGILGPGVPFAVELRAAPGGTTAQPALGRSCMYMGANGTEVADPAARLEQLVNGFGERSALKPICDRDLSGALLKIVEVFRRATFNPCIEVALEDADPRAAGLQADCAVEDVVGANVIEIASCDANLSARPCWRIESDPATCPSLLNLKLVVQRDVAPDPSTITRMRCAVAP